MEELLKKAEELKINVTENITEEQLKELIDEAEKESVDSNKKDKDKKDNSNKKDNKSNIRVIDKDNKLIDEQIKNDPTTIPKIKPRKELKQAKNGEYYEELGNGVGMWSRTGEVFAIKDLK